MIELITQLDVEGKLKQLIKFGIIPTTFITHYEIYLEVDKQKRTTKKNVNKIVIDVSERFDVSVNMVYRVMKKFKS